MEVFNVGDILISKTGNDEYTIVEVTEHAIAIRKRSSGMELTWWSKVDVKNQISMGVFEVKQ